MHIIPIYVMEFCFPYKPDTVKKAMDDVTDVLKAQKCKDIMCINYVL